jgi:hypothetical protein
VACVRARGCRGATDDMRPAAAAACRISSRVGLHAQASAAGPARQAPARYPGATARATACARAYAASVQPAPVQPAGCAVSDAASQAASRAAAPARVAARPRRCAARDAPAQPRAANQLPAAAGGTQLRAPCSPPSTLSPSGSAAAPAGCTRACRAGPQPRRSRRRHDLPLPPPYVPRTPPRACPRAPPPTPRAAPPARRAAPAAPRSEGGALRRLAARAVGGRRHLAPQLQQNRLHRVLAPPVGQHGERARLHGAVARAVRRGRAGARVSGARACMRRA